MANHRPADLSSLPFDELIAREWLVASGNGGFASSTICGLNSRKYHGLLVAAMNPPIRRMTLLSRLEESVLAGEKSFDLSCSEYPGAIFPQGHRLLRAFGYDPFPRWAYQGNGWTLEKQLRLIGHCNTVLLTYTLLGGANSITLQLRPLFALRSIHEMMVHSNTPMELRDIAPNHHCIAAGPRWPEVFFAHDGQFLPGSYWYLNTLYRREQQRGYAPMEDLWMPGVVRHQLAPGQSMHFVCSTEPIDIAATIAQADRQVAYALPPIAPPQPDLALDALLRASGQFVTAAGEQPAVVSAYPWAAPSLRDAMICLPGLFLVSGRLEEAKMLLSQCSGLLRDGLMPSELAEDGSGYRYQSADTSLWFIYAVSQYLRYRGDSAWVGREMMPAIGQIIQSCLRGSGLGIGVDTDGLLHTSCPLAPTTWMDAVWLDGKVVKQVITPRNGCPVEVNALWYNALRTAADLAHRFGQSEVSNQWLTLAGKVEEAFNRRFWNPATGCCFDVVDASGNPVGNDPAIRPNQLLAISLPYPVLYSSYYAAVLEKVGNELLTPVGVRTLSPREATYQPQYGGGIVQRERSLHQGSAFPWLLGPLVTACLRTAGHTQQARTQALNMLKGCFDHLLGPGLGQICELFDGQAPHAPGGAIASARSVAEILRCYMEDVLGLGPGAIEPRPRLNIQPPSTQPSDDPRCFPPGAV